MLQGELSHWQQRHQAVVSSMEASERKFLATVAELEASLTNIATLYEEKSAEFDAQTKSMSAAIAAFEEERDTHVRTVTAMNRDITEHKATIKAHIAKIACLEESQATSERQLDEADRFRLATQQHLEIHRDQISQLEQQLIEHQSAVEFHKHGLKSLHDSHSREIDDARSSSLLQAEAEARARIAELTAHHAEELTILRTRIDELDRQLQGHQTALAEHKQIVADQDAMIQKLQQGKAGHGVAKEEGENGLEDVQARLAKAEEAKVELEASLAKSQARIEELAWTKAELTDQLADLAEKEQRASRLVEELEGQLSSTFEDSRVTSGRLSLMQTARDQELIETRAANLKAQEEIDFLSKRLDQLEVKAISCRILHARLTQM